jgi:Ca-activated chloride channel family protein
VDSAGPSFPLEFAAPGWLIAGAVALGVLLLALRSADRRRRRDLARLVAPQILADLTGAVSPRRRAVRRALLLAGIGLAFVALARPELGFTWSESKRRGIDVMIAVDVSRSMLARDVTPDRLTRAKLGVVDLLERLEGDRVGLIAFAGSAFLQTPLTLDEVAFRHSLEALEPGVIPRGGTDLASAIRVAIRAFRTEKTNFKLLILLSDGEDLAGDALAAAEEAAAEQVRIYTIGVGTPGGELVPDPENPGHFVEDEGRIVKSRLDEATLRQIAERTGGFYAALGQRAAGVTEVYERALAPIPEEELASRMRRVAIERFQWPLALAVLFLLIEPLIGERKRVQRAKPLAPKRAENTPRTTAAALLALRLLVGAASAEAAPAEGEKAYRDGRFEESLSAYREAAKSDPDDRRLQFNVGAAAYKAKEFGAAAEAFAHALAAEDAPLKEQSFYNLGNARYRLGESSLATNPQSTAQAWRQAIASYEEALRIDAADADALFNRDFVKNKLEELEKQPPPQPSPSSQPSPQPSPQGSPEPSPQASPESSPQPGASGDASSDGDGSARPSPSPGEATPPPAPSPSPSAGGEPGDPKDGATPAPSPDADGRRPEDAPQQPEEPPPEPRPGQMSARDAADLLDALAGDEAALPAMVERGKPPSPDERERDW